MALEDYNEIYGLCEKLADVDAASRRQAAVNLTRKLENGYKGRRPKYDGDPDWMAAYRTGAVPQLATVLAKENDTEALAAMMELACSMTTDDTGLGLGGHTPALAVALVKRMSLSDFPKRLNTIAWDTIWRLDHPALLTAIVNTRNLPAFERVSFVRGALAGDPRHPEPNDERALLYMRASAALAASEHEDDWDSLFEIARSASKAAAPLPGPQRRYARKMIKSALLKVLQKSSGTMKTNAETTLGKAGFRRIGPWWF